MIIIGTQITLLLNFMAIAEQQTDVLVFGEFPIRILL